MVLQSKLSFSSLKTFHKHFTIKALCQHITHKVTSRGRVLVNKRHVHRTRRSTINWASSRLAPPLTCCHSSTRHFCILCTLRELLPSYPHRHLTPRSLGVSLALRKNYHSTNRGVLMKGLYKICRAQSKAMRRQRCIAREIE